MNSFFKFAFEKIPLPSPEMVGKFKKRTQEHIDRVYNNMVKMEGFNGLTLSELKKRGKEHDADKFSDELALPYSWVNWKHRCKRLGQKFDPPNGVIKASDDATKKHILKNKHHPESHATKPIGEFSRDSASSGESETVTVGDMSDLDIVEMVCDWTAMAQEFGENGGSAIGWANKNVGKRWLFTDDNVKTIYQAIEFLDKK